MAHLTNKLKHLLIDITGYWIYKKRYLPIGTDLAVDISTRLRFAPRTIFDVGANVGQTAKRFDSIFEGAKIYSFEPVNSTFMQLVGNLDSRRNIVLENIALGESDSTEEISLFEGELSVLNSLNQNSMNRDCEARKEMIKILKLDTYCSLNKIESIDLLKIDTEGYELQVLKGAQYFLESGKIKMILAEVGFNVKNKRNTHFNELNEFLTSYNFNFHSMYDVSNQFIKHGENFANVLYVHNQLFD
ncbi:FkbM family methyltransferase [Pontibacter pudoricolor]|uniref:FkbM family methyltransferase n=1 Tax=Pontibacter pudoricolor TaxID=2694930 RepID=UPI00139177E9|nr:FkbM family methyltransferase [Pontibacter pudoricolor]